MATSSDRSRGGRRRSAKSGKGASNPDERRGRPRQGKAVARDLPRDEEIIKIAAEIFYRQGFAGTTLDDIARDAGIVKGSLYHYFDSKEEIYERLMNNVVGTLDVREELSRNVPADERLLHILRARLVQTTSHPTEVGLISRQLIRMDGPVGEWARTLRRENFSVLRELIVQGQRDGCFRPGDPDILAATIMGLLTQVCDWYRPDGRVNRESLIEEMAKFVVGALRDSRRAVDQAKS